VSARVADLSLSDHNFFIICSNLRVASSQALKLVVKDVDLDLVVGDDGDVNIV
jgi:hypothetical protein